MINSYLKYTSKGYVGKMLEESDSSNTKTYWLVYKSKDFAKIGHIIISHGSGVSASYDFLTMPFTSKQDLIKYANANGITLEDAEYIQ